MNAVAGTPPAPEPVGGPDPVVTPARRRLAGWSVAIAMTGVPATVAVQVLGEGTAATAGATAIGTITVAALGAARAFMRDDGTTPPSPYVNAEMARAQLQRAGALADVLAAQLATVQNLAPGRQQPDQYAGRGPDRHAGRPSRRRKRRSTRPKDARDRETRDPDRRRGGR